MTFEIKHKFESLKADGTDPSLVKPSDWNDDHNVTSDVDTGIVLGVSSGAATDDIVDLPFDISATGRIQGKGTEGFTPPSGTTATRPTTPRPGEMRYNSDTQSIEIYGLGGTTTWTTIGSGAFSPAGTVIAYAGLTPPPGWLTCNGQSVSRTAHPNLFAAIGTKYGGDTTPTFFNVPNYIDRVLVGAGSSYTVGQQKGAFFQAVPLPAHQHSLIDSDGNIQNFPMPFNSAAGVTGTGNALLDGAKTIIGTDIKGTAGVQMSVEQPGTGVLYCIRGG